MHGATFKLKCLDSDSVILVILDAEIVYYICKLGTNVGRKD